MANFNTRDLEQAIEDLAMCEFFPREPGPQAGVMRLLVEMVPSREALRWLVDTYTNRIGKWHGPAELRAVLCTRYKPQDGIEGWSQLPGFTAADSEERSYAQHEQLKAGGTLPAPEKELLRGRIAEIAPRLLAGKGMR